MLKKITLAVPYHDQPDSSPFCSAASAKMVLEFHGVRMSLRRLVKDIGVTDSYGVSLPGLGSWFQENGYRVTIVACPTELPPRLAYMPWEQLTTELRRWCQRPHSQKRGMQHTLRISVQRFLDAGGRFEYRPVQWRDIGKALDRGEPPILNVVTSSYAPSRNWNAGHYVVPTGIDRKALDFHDPIYGPMTLKREHALHVCHVRRGGAIFISPKK